jgi:hypothetical protein
MSLYDSFEYLKHKLWSKEGPRMQMSIWLPMKLHELRGEHNIALDVRISLKCHNMLVKRLASFDIIPYIKMSVNYSNKRSKNVRGK